MDPACVVSADPGEDLAAGLVSAGEPGLCDELSFEDERTTRRRCCPSNLPPGLRIGSCRVGPSAEAKSPLRYCGPLSE